SGDQVFDSPNELVETYSSNRKRTVGIIVGLLLRNRVCSVPSFEQGYGILSLALFSCEDSSYGDRTVRMSPTFNQRLDTLHLLQVLLRYLRKLDSHTCCSRSG